VGQSGLCCRHGGFSGPGTGDGSSDYFDQLLTFGSDIDWTVAAVSRASDSHDSRAGREGYGQHIKTEGFGFRFVGRFRGRFWLDGRTLHHCSLESGKWRIVVYAVGFCELFNRQNGSVFGIFDLIRRAGDPALAIKPR